MFSPKTIDKFPLILCEKILNDSDFPCWALSLKVVRRLLKVKSWNIWYFHKIVQYCKEAAFLNKEYCVTRFWHLFISSKKLILTLSALHAWFYSFWSECITTNQYILFSEPPPHVYLWVNISILHLEKNRSSSLLFMLDFIVFDRNA